MPQDESIPAEAVTATETQPVASEGPSYADTIDALSPLEREHWQMTGNLPETKTTETQPQVADKTEKRTPTGKPETAPVLETGEELEEPEHLGTTEQKKASRQAWARIRTEKAQFKARAELAERQLTEKAIPAKAAPVAAAVKAEPAAAALAKPKSDDFATYDEFLDARDKYNRALWDSEQAAKTREAEQAKTLAEFKAKSDSHVKSFNEREAVVMAKSPEYAEHFKAFLDVANKTQPLADAIFESEIGPDVADHLGSHPEDLAKLAKLSPGAIWKEIGKLEDKLSQTPLIKKVTTAPAPGKTVPAKATAVDDPIEAAAERGDWRTYNRLINEQELSSRRSG